MATPESIQQRERDYDKRTSLEPSLEPLSRDDLNTESTVEITEKLAIRPVTRVTDILFSYRGCSIPGKVCADLRRQPAEFVKFARPLVESTSIRCLAAKVVVAHAFDLVAHTSAVADQQISGSAAAKTSALEIHLTVLPHSNVLVQLIKPLSTCSNPTSRSFASKLPLSNLRCRRPADACVLFGYPNCLFCWQVSQMLQQSSEDWLYQCYTSAESCRDLHDVASLLCNLILWSYCLGIGLGH